MDEAGPNVLKQLDEGRRAYINQFLEDNQDLTERIEHEGASVAFDTEEDLLAIDIGSPREAASFSVDGELYLRTDLDSNKLVSAELYHFTEHVQKRDVAMTIMVGLIQLAQHKGSVPFTLIPRTGAASKQQLDENIRELAAI